MTDFSHIDGRGRVRMVDVSGKPPLRRTAVAAGEVTMRPETIERLRAGALAKGEALAAARIAGIQAAKRTGELIPLCHPLPLDHVAVDLVFRENRVEIEATAVTTARTGVEMEALTAVAVAALTLYDMCKAVDREMTIGPIRLTEKTKEEP
ncbi:MAG: cyclic pyranopterin monophosphate synthase MoaC [Candidatus Krumholzibacteriota bacterium]|nr:cyclic pyranopterin monophosphate synthase MoaC [Candidatus Krumholzibacteriota bacterium]